MTEILDHEPDVPDGDDQNAKPDDAEPVTEVDLKDTPDLDEDDLEGVDGDDA